MRLDDFDYFLPEDLIAQYPAASRSESRLLHVHGDRLQDLRFTDLPGLAAPGDVAVFNDTKVIRARLFGRKPTGGEVELLVERVMENNEALVLARASKTPKPGSRVMLDAGVELEILGRQGDLFHLRCHADVDFLEILEQQGHLPLPPYISHIPGNLDETRYQTVYAQHAGSVAAPTAGLHFDEAMLAKLDESGVIRANVTLHVGAGTFQPVRVQDIHDHKMHSERYHIPQETVEKIETARAQGKRILAVGTTSLRTLEAAALRGPLEAHSGETDLFITPGFEFRIANRLLTNFHLPKSTLLMLVSAFGGHENLRNAYKHAVEQRYRFFSYGDAMLIERHP